MEFQDIAKATVENFTRYAERHVVEGQALQIEAEAKGAQRAHHRLHVPSFIRRGTTA